MPMEDIAVHISTDQKDHARGDPCDSHAAAVPPERDPLVREVDRIARLIKSKDWPNTSRDRQYELLNFLWDTRRSRHYVAGEKAREALVEAFHELVENEFEALRTYLYLDQLRGPHRGGQPRAAPRCRWFRSEARTLSWVRAGRDPPPPHGLSRGYSRFE